MKNNKNILILFILLYLYIHIILLFLMGLPIEPLKKGEQIFQVKWETLT